MKSSMEGKLSFVNKRSANIGMGSSLFAAAHAWWILDSATTLVFLIWSLYFIYTLSLEEDE